MRHGSVPTALGFTSQRQDGTGLAYYNARYYDPTIGRFASADTVSSHPTSAQSWNRYSYVQNNPLRYIDPSGHCLRNANGEDVPGHEGENALCDMYISYLSGWGIDLDMGSFNLWMSDMLENLWNGLVRMSDKMGWGTDGRRFQEEVLKHRRLTVTKVNSEHVVGSCRSEGGGLFGCTEGDGSKITFSSLFGRNRDGQAPHWSSTQGLVVHELAHVWDFRSFGAVTSGLGTAYDLRGIPRPSLVEMREIMANAVSNFVIEGTPGMVDMSFPQSVRRSYVQCLSQGGAAGDCGVWVGLRPPFR